RRFDYELPDFTKKRGGALRFTLMVKVTPGLPQFVRNYGLGVAGVPFPLYFVASMVLSGAYGVALIVLGESLFRHQSRRSIGIAAVVIAFGRAIWIWKRRRARD